MARITNGRLRRLWLDIHLWIGVGLLVALVPIAVSGALLVWHEPLERAVEHERFAVSDSKATLAPSAYLAAAEAAFAGRAQPTSLRLPEHAGEPVVVVGRLDGPPGPNGRPRQLTAWLDPADARVTDVADTSKSVFSVLHRLHGTLLIPQVGRKVVGWMGWAMSISCVTGLLIWWPRNGAVAKGLRWKRTPMVMDNLHHMLGFWICIPLLATSLTGVYISFPQTSRAVFGVSQPQGQGGQRPGPPRAPAPIRPQMSLDAAYAQAQGFAPGAELTSVTFPTRGKEPAWRFEMRNGGKPLAVQVADATGEAKADRAPRAGRAGMDKTSRLMRQIHDGGGTGPIWQTILFLAGIIPAILAVTGVVMWLRKQSRKLATARRLAAAE